MMNYRINLHRYMYAKKIDHNGDRARIFYSINRYYIPGTKFFSFIPLGFQIKPYSL